MDQLWIRFSLSLIIFIKSDPHQIYTQQLYLLNKKDSPMYQALTITGFAEGQTYTALPSVESHFYISNRDIQVTNEANLNITPRLSLNHMHWLT